MQSIDRKLARVAREIEEAKPKGMSFAEFEHEEHNIVTLGRIWHYVEAADCRQIKDNCCAQPSVAAPPSHVFSPGDVVEYIREWCVEYGVPSLSGKRHVVKDMGREGIVNFTDGSCEEVEALRLIPSEPKAEDGWIEWKGGEPPVRFNDRGQARFADGYIWEGCLASLLIDRWLHQDDGLVSPKDYIVAYRVIA
jgi:hypothetical protein